MSNKLNHKIIEREDFLDKVFPEMNAIFSIWGRPTEEIVNMVIENIIPIYRSHSFTKNVILNWERNIKSNELLEKSSSEIASSIEKIRSSIASDDPLIEILDDLIKEGQAGGDCLNVKESPIKRIYPRLHSLYIQAVKDNCESPFCPSANALLMQDKTSVFEQRKIEPQNIWKKIILFEDCWSTRNEQHSTQWPKIEATGKDLWLIAEKNFKQAFRNMLSGELLTPEIPSFSSSYFDDFDFYSLFNRVIFKISFQDFDVNYGTVSSRDNDKIINYIDQCWKKNPKAKHNPILTDLKNYISKHPNWLERKGSYADSTLLSKIRKLDSRSKKPRGPGHKKS